MISIQLKESHTTLPQQGPSSIVLPTIQNSPRKISQTTQLRRVELTNGKKNKSLQYFWAKKKNPWRKKGECAERAPFLVDMLFKEQEFWNFFPRPMGASGIKKMITNSNKAVVLGRNPRKLPYICIKFDSPQNGWHLMIPGLSFAVRSHQGTFVSSPHKVGP